MKGCRPLEVAEVNRAYAAFSGRQAVRDRCLFVLGVSSGFRVSEMLSLRIADVIRDGRVSKTVSVARKAMKGKKESRTVPLTPAAQRAILAQVIALRQQGYWTHDCFLFRSERGNKPIRREVAWRIVHGKLIASGSSDDAGKLGTHSLRKTFAGAVYDTMLSRLAAGIHCDPLLETARALGHRDPKSTVSYLQFRNDHQTAAIDAIGKRYAF